MLSRTPITQSVARKVQEMILNGELKPGDRIPSQRVFSESLGVSRASLREALLTIETLGLIRTEPGRGTFVTGNHGSHRRGMENWRYADSYPAQDVFAGRVVLETKLARFAALHCTARLVELLNAATDEMEASWEAHDLVTHVEADKRFHSAIAHGCGNRLLITLYETVCELMYETQRQPIPMTAPGRMRASIGEHRSIVAAVKSRDGAAAEQAMDKHIRNTAACVGIVLN